MDTRNFGSVRFGTSFGHDYFGNDLYKGQEVIAFEDEDGAKVILDADNWDAEHEWLHQHIDKIGAKAFIEDNLGDLVGDWVLKQYPDDQVVDRDVLKMLINQLADSSEQRLNKLLAVPLNEQVKTWVDDIDYSIVTDYYNGKRETVGEE